MCSNKVLSWVSVITLLAGCNSVFAVENKMRVSGFLTTIVTQTHNSIATAYGNNLASDQVEWDTRDSHLGIQFANSINSKIDVTAQFMTHGGIETYDLVTDWAYIDYKALDSLQFRVGRYKIPQFILSDYLGVGYAYPWVRPPQDVYSTNPLISLSGIDLLLKIDLGQSKVLIDLFVGDGTHKTPIPPRSVDLSQGSPQEIPLDRKGELIFFDTKGTEGISVKYIADTFSLRAGYFNTKVDAPDFGLFDAQGAFGGVGFTMDVANIIAYAEYIRRNTAPGAKMEAAFPDQDAWYVTLGYRFGKLLPILTYSTIEPGLDTSPTAIEETSVALGLRYDIADSADIKFEAMHVKPENGNHGLFFDPVDLGNVYSASFDVIF